MRTDKLIAIALLSLAGWFGGAEVMAAEEGREAPRAQPAQSVDDLFGVDSSAADDANAGDVDSTESVDDLFGTEDQTSAPNNRGAAITDQVEGFFQNELGYTYPDPDRFSKVRNHLRLSLQGQVNETIKWKIGGHFIYDAIFDLDDFYNVAVEDDQEFDARFHETFIDITTGKWAVRLGRQDIVWGEVIGLFFADVVSALDLREYILSDFDLMRIPQWAARAEYYGERGYLDILYVPYVTTDRSGAFGGDFYPIQGGPPIGMAYSFLDEDEPEAFSDAGYGIRGALLRDGWDIALFYYTSPDKGSVFERRIVAGPTPTVTFREIHDRIHQLGATLAKDAGSGILKAEAVFTADRLNTVEDPFDADGLAKSNELRYLVGYELAFDKHNFNVQFFQTWFTGHLPTMPQDEVESGFSLFFTTQALHPKVQPELLWIRSLNRNEWLLQGKVIWTVADNWRFVVGADIFDGPAAAPLLGQYRDKDRVYYELRYSF